MDLLPPDRPTLSPPPLPADPFPENKAPAALLLRSVAFGMDALLLTALLAFLLTRVLLPASHPEGLKEFNQLIQTYWTELEAARETNTEPPAAPPFIEYPAVVGMITYSQMLCLFIMTLYFGLTEGLMNGTTLGKKVFRLQTLRQDTEEPPGIFVSLLRGAFKSLTLVASPLFWTFFAVAILSRQRLTIHDLLTRTRVVRANP